MSPDILQQLERAAKNADLLSSWENGFVESLTEQFNKQGRLSPRQIEILKRIEEQKLSSQAQESHHNWTEKYDDEKRRIAMICAKYYLKAGYFTNLATSVVEDASYVPPEKAWKKMCQNKYALKVVAEHDATPKYDIGSIVEFRATADWSMKTQAKGMPCVVISSDGTVISAAKGSKPYKVLPYGSISVINCEERHLKKCKNPQKKNTNFVDNGVPF